jgi:hypothetical protein
MVVDSTVLASAPPTATPTLAARRRKRARSSYTANLNFPRNRSFWPQLAPCGTTHSCRWLVRRCRGTAPAQPRAVNSSAVSDICNASARSRCGVLPTCATSARCQTSPLCCANTARLQKKKKKKKKKSVFFSSFVEFCCRECWFFRLFRSDNKSVCRCSPATGARGCCSSPLRRTTHTTLTRPIRSIELCHLCHSLHCSVVHHLRRRYCASWRRAHCCSFLAKFLLQSRSPDSPRP